MAEVRWKARDTPPPSWRCRIKVGVTIAQGSEDTKQAAATGRSDPVTLIGAGFFNCRLFCEARPFKDRPGCLAERRDIRPRAH